MSFFYKFVESKSFTFAGSIDRNKLISKKENMKQLVNFFEIPSADFTRAVKFYEAVFNLKLSVCECETEKMAFFPDEDSKCLVQFRLQPISYLLQREFLSISR